MEILNSSRTKEEIYEMLHQLTKYILENDVVLREGDVICLSEEHEFQVEWSQGVFTEGLSVKISY